MGDAVEVSDDMIDETDCGEDADVTAQVCDDRTTRESVTVFCGGRIPLEMVAVVEDTAKTRTSEAAVPGASVAG